MVSLCEVTGLRDDSYGGWLQFTVIYVRRLYLNSV